MSARSLSNDGGPGADESAIASFKALVETQMLELGLEPANGLRLLVHYRGKTYELTVGGRPTRTGEH